MDLPSLRALREEWRLHPPVHLVAAAWIQYEPPEPAGTSPDAPRPGGARMQPVEELGQYLPVSNGPARPIDDSAWLARQVTLSE